jgi:PTH1 family peptidyl-tRNA hydrolase
MKLIVGLGNIGAHYDGTRHNAGFAVLEVFAAAHNLEWQAKDKFKAHIAEGMLHGQKIMLVKPTTFYNLVGESIRAIKDFYKVENTDILIIHDELALPYGTLRTRTDGSDAGNNGMKSIIAHVGADVARVRIGIANDTLPRQDAADFVLGRFTAEEREQWQAVQHEATVLIHNFIDNNKTFGHISIRTQQ